jgi:hypothetical protein
MWACGRWNIVLAVVCSLIEMRHNNVKAEKRIWRSSRRLWYSLPVRLFTWGGQICLVRLTAAAPRGCGWLQRCVDPAVHYAFDPRVLRAARWIYIIFAYAPYHPHPRSGRIVFGTIISE